MAFNTEFVMGAGGPGPVDFTVGTINDTDRVVHSFNLTAPSLVSVALPGITGLSENGRWVAPAPCITLSPVGQAINYGVNWFRTSLIVSTSTTGTAPDNEKNSNNANLSICAQLPAGSYQVRVNTYGSSRSYSLGTGKIVITPI